MAEEGAEAALRRAATRVEELIGGYEPPDFAEVPSSDAALFLTAIDHGSGYEGEHLVDGEGPFKGSALLWALGIAAERRRPGTLSAAGLAAIGEQEVAEMFRIDGQTAAGPPLRVRLWRGLAAGLAEHYEASAAALIVAGEGRLGGEGGMLKRLAGFEAYSDPLQKKSFLFCKIAARRGWLGVSDPQRWQVCADSVLMRLALRAGVVEPGETEAVRAATRSAWKRVSELSGVSPPLLDDLLWERGRDDRDLIGAEAGDLSEPPRPAGTFFY